MDSKEPSSVAIIIINWNGYSLSRRCLLSLMQIHYSNYTIVLVDNGSEDGSFEKLKREFETPVFIANEKNLGFTGGNNAGIDYAIKNKFDFILLLNNDTEVEPDFLNELLKVQKSHPNVGMVQPLILFHDKRDKIWSAGGRYIAPLGIAKTLDSQKNFQTAKVEDKVLDWATGCCILIPRQIIEKVGTLQQSYFAYFEDVDWSLRIRKAGYLIYLAAKSTIYHEGGASSKKAHKEGMISPTVFYLYCRNQLFQLRRHLDFPFWVIAWPFHIGKYLIWISYFCIRGRFKKMKAVAKGIRDGIFLDHHHNEPLCP
ncbi:glycosyltransferase family 2 protein [Shivajiella indica]|uniref:Glycosyltransferase family 2 protein n=1 Tax=Shivajiella indica TaxID=872115 RepID=A0ABW5BEW1_9BACT